MRRSSPRIRPRTFPRRRTPSRSVTRPRRSRSPERRARPGIAVDADAQRLGAGPRAPAVAFGICFWQNTNVLRLINRPLADQTQQQVRAGHGPLGATYTVQRSARDIAQELTTVVGVLGTQTPRPAATAGRSTVKRNLAHDVSVLSAPPPGDRPVTLGIGEPFT